MCSMVTSIEEGDWELTKINKWLDKRSSLPFAGKLPSISRLIDNLRIENGPEWTEDLLEKIKKSFRYVFGTPSNEGKFRGAFDKIKSTGVTMTSFQTINPCMWICKDFKMIERALGLKKVFSELEQIDADFKLVNLTKEEWEKATVALEYAKLLKEAADSLSESKYTTLNVYFPKLCDLFMRLLQWEKSDNCYVSQLASSMRDKYFDNYWSSCKLALVIAIVLDPRFKLDIVECWYKEIYGDDEAKRHFKEITDDVKTVYYKYAKGPRMLDAMGRPCSSSQNTSAQQELDHYLKEPKFPSVEEFDILAWWCDNSTKFLTLARMASDFLAIPISNTGIADSPSLKIEFQNIFYCEGLDVEIRNALICTKSWLESPQKD
ncbi:hypothetical protein Pint_25917 [Pistacia integerrima]|uniref:Uncharacterized protein n=1 Tax=Pistacia integerrima TaxID=434235 RepID=A0ACC0YFC8_9ROSI|nr:hypothetical protein Pint_25917 [Pistacia integerrima]